jgi:hypothetical protein
MKDENGRKENEKCYADMVQIGDLADGFASFVAADGAYPGGSPTNNVVSRGNIYLNCLPFLTSLHCILILLTCTVFMRIC